ncbi:hypothetical protein PS914_03874 [Pseudomonas fluorescens]|uniref:Uncharacterized protein n=1 Tax=Pseudomonas fluorescens TaxID=294 RepID=A0A5E7TKR9_PSEFL|nr:hypothetical protein PS833_02761 [Pseudomonas fluorescens]VVP98979.1 hypothetical protein PS914_03874 [Pseudomonas fluorescens]
MTSCLNNSLLPAATPAPVMTMIPMGTRPPHRPAPHQEREQEPDLEADREVAADLAAGLRVAVDLGVGVAVAVAPEVEVEEQLQLFNSGRRPVVTRLGL